MTERAGSAMGSDSIRYLIFSFGRWRWKPTRVMRAAGFQQINFGKTISVADKARAIELNEAWDRHRRGLGEPSVLRRYPPAASVMAIAAPSSCVPPSVQP